MMFSSVPAKSRSLYTEAPLVNAWGKLAIPNKRNLHDSNVPVPLRTPSSTIKHAPYSAMKTTNQPLQT